MSVVENDSDFPSPEGPLVFFSFCQTGTIKQMTLNVSVSRVSAIDSPVLSDGP